MSAEQVRTMRIAVGSDHAGFGLKEELMGFIAGLGHEVIDAGTFSPDKSTDYPDWSARTAELILSGRAERGVLVCGTGIGMSIAANKVPGIYAALCSNEYMARMSRQHNDANVLVLGSRVTGSDAAREIARVWLSTDAEGGRHLDRRRKIYESEPPRSPRAADLAARFALTDHPLIKHKMTILRDKGTCTREFRELTREIAALMACEVTRSLPLEETEVETPICRARGFRLAGKEPAVVSVLRAGLEMAEGFLSVMPGAKVGHVGVYRDPETIAPVSYFCRLPGELAERDIFIVDPMLATGGSASAAAARVKQEGGRRITLVSMVAAPEGVRRVAEEHPDIDIRAAVLDSGLNERCFIVPGLGDAGDRLFGTE